MQSVIVRVERFKLSVTVALSDYMSNVGPSGRWKHLWPLLSEERGREAIPFALSWAYVRTYVSKLTFRFPRTRKELPRKELVGGLRVASPTAVRGRVSDAPVSWRLTSYPTTVMQRVGGIHMLPAG